MKNVAIITYHGAYNYGSVFQAYATQEALKNWDMIHVLSITE